MCLSMMAGIIALNNHSVYAINYDGIALAGNTDNHLDATGSKHLNCTGPHATRDHVGDSSPGQKGRKFSGFMSRVWDVCPRYIRTVDRIDRICRAMAKMGRHVIIIMRNCNLHCCSHRMLPESPAPSAAESTAASPGNAPATNPIDRRFFPS
jgi:hypothetical protein